MAKYAEITDTGDGVTTDYEFTIPRISNDDVKAYVDGVAATIAHVSDNTFRITPAPAVDAAIVIRRETDDSEVRYSFPNRSYIRSTNLDGNTTQYMYLLQELSDRALFSVNGVEADADNNAATVAGPTGATGPAGPTGPAGISYAGYVEVTAVTDFNIDSTKAGYLYYRTDAGGGRCDVILLDDGLWEVGDQVTFLEANSSGSPLASRPEDLGAQEIVGPDMMTNGTGSSIVMTYIGSDLWVCTGGTQVPI